MPQPVLNTMPEYLNHNSGTEYSNNEYSDNEYIDNEYTESIPLESITDQQHKSAHNMTEVEQAQDQNYQPPVDLNDVDDPLLDQQIRHFQTSQKPKVKRILEAIWYGPDQIKDEPVPPIRWLNILERAAQRFQSVSPRVKAFCLSGYLLFWFLCVYNILSPYFNNPPIASAPGTDTDDIRVLNLGCTDQLWKGKNGACGLDGKECVRGPDQKDVFIRCPALCDRSWTYSLEPIGYQRIKYRGYFIGGGSQMDTSESNQLTNPYRADSYICGSAAHAGLISPFTGGCARISYASGPQSGFNSQPGHYGVDDSIAFSSFFPSSYFFKELKAGLDAKLQFHQCYDPRLPILVINIILGFPIVYLASGQVMFWTMNTVGFWTIVLATDPPIKVDSNDRESYASLLSIGLERFLPTCFILYGLWTFSTKITLSIPRDEISKVSYLSRVVYFYPLFWLGVLNNISFDRLPVDRLTISDLKEQPGGAIAVAGIITLIVTCAIIQAYKIWQAGKFKKYLFIYLSFILGLFLVSQLPGLTLRVHHYILAMLLIPGCCTRGATAMLFQGILLGLFLSGAARWGLAAIAETDTSLRRNDPSGKILPPELLGFDNSTGILSWADFPGQGNHNEFNGISILINDIERYVAANISSVNVRELFDNSTELTTLIREGVNSHFGDPSHTIPLYIRIGRKIMGTSKYGDFSNAAMLSWPEGTIRLPKPGIT